MTVTTDNLRNGTFNPASPGPIGATSPNTGGFTTVSYSGDLNSTGSASRYKVDASNATIANRWLLQTSTTDSSSNIGVIPNGTSTSSSYNAYNASDPTNAPAIRMLAGSTIHRLESFINGSGSYLPLGLYNGNVNAFTIETNGLSKINYGLSIIAKSIVNNGATTTYTVPASLSYIYLVTSAASLAITLPAGTALIDGMVIIITPSASVAAVTWASTGTTFIGAPSAFVANTPSRMIYDHNALKWYPI